MKFAENDKILKKMRLFFIMSSSILIFVALVLSLSYTIRNAIIIFAENFSADKSIVYENWHKTLIHYSLVLMFFSVFLLFVCRKLSYTIICLFTKFTNMSLKLKCLNILFISCGTFLTFVLSRGSTTTIDVILSSFILAIIFINFNVLQRVIQSNFKKYNALLSIIFSISAIYLNTQRFGDKYIVNTHNLIVNLCAICIIIAAVLFVSFLYYWCFILLAPKCKLFFKNIDKTEKMLLIVISIFMCIFISVVFTKTNVFYGAEYNGSIVDFDIIYMSDSGNLMETNVYMNIGAPENDIRQPLFGLFALPFGTIAWIVSKIFFSIPNAYPIIITIIQAILLQICILLIARLLFRDILSKLAFSLICLSLYPTLLFSVMAEQYVFAVFWLIVFIYSCLNNSIYKKFLLIAATGSLMPSGILFPLLMDSKNVKQSIKTLLKLALLFVIIIILAGQFQLLLVNIIPIGGGGTIAGLLNSFGGKSIDFSNRLLQYINFVSLCLFHPDEASINYSNGYATWQLGNITTLNIKGIIILLLSILGFVLNNKKTFARTCMGWVFFSFLILCLIGWGTAENGLILYTLYFSWAFISLIILGFEKILSKYYMIKYILYTIMFITLLWINSKGILEIIYFGLDKYPI